MIEIDANREKALLYLHDRKGTWVKSKELAAASGYSTKATCVELRNSMRVANLRGAPVITAAKGFMWAIHPNQLKRAAERLDSRAKEITTRAEALRKAEKEMMRLWDEKSYTYSQTGLR